MGKFGNKRLPKFMKNLEIDPNKLDEVDEFQTNDNLEEMSPLEILSLGDHGDNHAMIVIRTENGEELELKFDYDGNGMLIAQHNDHEYSIPVEIEVVSDEESDENIYEISNAIKLPAFKKAWQQSKDIDPGVDPFTLAKRKAQMYTFEKQVSRELKTEAEKIAKMLGPTIEVNISKSGGGEGDEYEQGVSLRFYDLSNQRTQPTITITIYMNRVHTEGVFPEPVQRRLSRFIDKVRAEEINSPTNNTGFDDTNRVAESFQQFMEGCCGETSEGYNPAMSEESKRAVKALCENFLINEAQRCDEDQDPTHTYENYLAECGSYMVECMMEAASTVNVEEEE